ncbi:hypothetical protein J3R82DRAFT_6373 [Butyriboletus roseoflavus]|nr:hypothetical protein J3R82DRAFT_6373 [Butyriboletus roseoflavus]
MPGPGNKRKAKGDAKARGGTKETLRDIQATSADTYSLPCLTLEEDEITRCGQVATQGYPKPERCKVHHGQYRVMYKKYKEASKVVDDVKGSANLPTKEQIGRYTDWHAALEKSRWVRKYLEAIRVEKAGRHIHQRRFFLKVDDGHRRRLKLLEREMIKAVDVLDALQKRAFELHQHNDTLHAMNDQARSTAEVDLENQSKQTTEEVLQNLSRYHVPQQWETEDLIDMSLRAGKEQMIEILKPFLDYESFVEVFEEVYPQPKTGHSKAVLERHFFIYQQFARRIIFHEPSLFMKSLEKVSFKDLILSDDFSMEDIARFLHLFMDPLAFPLKWFKDAVLDALAMSRHGTAANVGSVENRSPLLGGWVFNRSHKATMSNEAWWILLKILAPPANIENRFRSASFQARASAKVHLSSTLMIPACQRNHLSLSGVIIADMVASPKPPEMCRPMPTTRRATKRGCIAWAEIETRAYMFGAVRNEKDGFVEAFFRELRARPDLFQVVIRSETAPGREVEVFGSGPLNNEALPAMRGRSFEAPPSPTSPFPAPVSTSGKWEVFRSAVDVLYGTGDADTVRREETDAGRREK